MSSDQKLQDLSKQLEDTVSRIDSLQKNPTLTARLGRHFRSQGSHLLSIVLAGCVLSVAVGRLLQRNAHELEREQWQDEKQLLAQEANRLQQRGDALEALLTRTKQGVLAELDSGGFRLDPVAGRIRCMLAPVRSASGQQQQSPQTDSSPAEKQGVPQKSQSGARPKIMI